MQELTCFCENHRKKKEEKRNGLKEFDGWQYEKKQAKNISHTLKRNLGDLTPVFYKEFKKAINN